MNKKIKEELIWCAEEAKRLLDAQNSKTKKFQRASYLARKGLKNTEEFRQLELFLKQPTVVDFGNVIERLAQCAGKIK